MGRLAARIIQVGIPEYMHFQRTMITGNIRKRLPAFVSRTASLLFFPLLIFMPGTAHGDDLSATLRYTYGNRAFPVGSFSTSTHPSDTTSLTQLRINGRTALWGQFFSDYDLRYGFARRSRNNNGSPLVVTNSGPQDQNIGIGYMLDTGETTSQWMRVSVVIPAGHVYQSPKLSSGQWAIEPVYHMNVPGPWDMVIGFDIGSRIFVDGGSAQFRTRLQASKALTQRLRLAAGVTLWRSAIFSSYNAAVDSGEIGNIVRPGVQVQYRIRENTSTYLSYEKYIAGMGGSASQRVTLGFSFSY